MESTGSGLAAAISLGRNGGTEVAAQLSVPRAACSFSYELLPMLLAQSGQNPAASTL